jgi:hypothetical protein
MISEIKPDRSKGCVAGKLFDQYGPKWILLSGTFCVVSSMMMTSLCKTFAEYILAQGVLFGLGVGLVCVSPTSNHGMILTVRQVLSMCF